jgi:hypothetical protein
VENNAQIIGSVALIALAIVSHFLFNPDDWGAIVGMGKLRQFISDAGAWGVASNFASLIFWILSVAQASKKGAASITTFVFLAVSLPLFWIGAYLAWSKARSEVDKARSEVTILTELRIRIIGVPPPQHDQYNSSSEGDLFRVDVFNASPTRSVPNVEVKLIDIQPSVAEVRLPLPLVPMHERQNRSVFQLDPQDHRLVDVVYNRSDEQGIRIHHNVSGVLNLLPSGVYVLTVQATGTNVPVERKRLRVWDTDGMLHCEMLP